MIRKHVVWGNENPFSDPRLQNVANIVKQILERRYQGGAVGGTVFSNSDGTLPSKPHGYYHEYDLGRAPAGEDRGKLRLVIGDRCEVYITGDHYGSFRQVIQIPGSAPPFCPLCALQGRNGVVLLSGRCDNNRCNYRIR